MRAQLFRSGQLRDVLEAVRRLPNARQALVERMVRRLESVGAVFVPTCDEFYLSHAIDDYRQLLKQAYFFESIEDAPRS